MLKGFKQAVYPTISKYFINTVLMEGVLKGSDQPFRCFLADNSLYNEYLSSMIYEAPPNIISRRKIWVPTLKKMVENSKQDFDLCIAVLPSRYETQFQGLYDFKSRKLVHQIIDTSGPWEGIRGRFHKTKKRFSDNVAKCGLWHSSISTDIKDFDFFYHRMFVPHITKHFGSLSIIDSYEDLKQHFLQGFLLFVDEGSGPVAAALCQVEEQTLIYKRAGVLDGNYSYIKAGAQMAFYYYMLRFAKENNLTQLDTMNSGAFFNDGVFRHKRDWGATVYPDDAVTWVYFFIPNRSEKVVRFFEQNPLIVHTEKGLKGLAGLTDSEMSPKIKKDLYHQYYTHGLEGMIFLMPHSKGPLEMVWKDLHEAHNHY